MHYQAIPLFWLQEIVHKHSVPQLYTGTFSKIYPIKDMPSISPLVNSLILAYLYIITPLYHLYITFLLYHHLFHLYITFSLSTMVTILLISFHVLLLL